MFDNEARIGDWKSSPSYGYQRSLKHSVVEDPPSAVVVVVETTCLNGTLSNMAYMSGSHPSSGWTRQCRNGKVNHELVTEFIWTSICVSILSKKVEIDIKWNHTLRHAVWSLIFVLRILAGCWVNDNVLYEQRNIIVNLQLVTLNMNISIVVSNRRWNAIKRFVIYRNVEERQNSVNFQWWVFHYQSY